MLKRLLSLFRRKEPREYAIAAIAAQLAAEIHGNIFLVTPDKSLTEPLLEDGVRAECLALAMVLCDALMQSRASTLRNLNHSMVLDCASMIVGGGPSTYRSFWVATVEAINVVQEQYAGAIRQGRDFYPRLAEVLYCRIRAEVGQQFLSDAAVEDLGSRIEQRANANLAKLQEV